jgi:hypothetical protein
MESTMTTCNVLFSADLLRNSHVLVQEEVDPNDWTAKGFDNKAWLKEGIKLAQNKGNSQPQALYTQAGI